MKHHPQTSKYGKLSPCDGCKHIAKSTGDLPCRECFMIAKPSEYDASKNSNSISPKSQLSKDNLSTCGVDEKQQE